MQLTDHCSPFFSKTVSSNFFLAFFLERGCIFEAPCKSPSNGPAENLFAGSEEGCMPMPMTPSVVPKSKPKPRPIKRANDYPNANANDNVRAKDNDFKHGVP